MRDVASETPSKARSSAFSFPLHLMALQWRYLVRTADGARREKDRDSSVIMVRLFV